MFKINNLNKIQPIICNVIPEERRGDLKKVVSGILLLLSFSGILISIFGSQPSEAQAPETGWTLYTSGAEITALVDDGDFLWVGSYGGLAKLNKNTGDMTRYNTANSGLPDNMISSIAKDVNGDLWIGTDNGLARFNGVSWVVYNSGNSPLPRNDITC